MKTNFSGMSSKNIFLGTLLTIVILILTSCGTTAPFLTSSVVPAATGKVKIKRDNNQNYAIKVNVDNLAGVEKLQSSKQMYIVWMETDRGNTENLGQLNSSSGFMSKKLSASLETVSSFKPVRIYVTSEFIQDVRYPGTEEILTTKRFYK